MSKPACFHSTDGGAARDGFTTTGNDCVYRALAIATDTPYHVMASWLDRYIKVYENRRVEQAPNVVFYSRAVSSRVQGVLMGTWYSFMTDIFTDWIYVKFFAPLPMIQDILPAKGPVIVSLCERHVCTVIDGVLHDDGNIWGKKTMSGYWRKKTAEEKK